jgi:hypothetical protein
MNPTKRRKISGFTLNFRRYSLEFVTINYIPRVFSIWQSTRHIYRLEF